MKANLRLTTSDITLANHWDHFLARLGIRRDHHRIEPGIYALGNPSSQSDVFVSANYTLSFDSLRRNLKDRDCYILVLDTHGINVWCAAGKGTFGTDELVNRIEQTGLKTIVKHRKLILPQLAAPGVSAHEVHKDSGFRVDYGPVRATDLPAYLADRKASVKMRQVRFSLIDRLFLIPVELVHVLLPLFVLGLLFYLLNGLAGVLTISVAIIAGVVLFPLLLPWIPTHNFSTKGFVLGGLVSIPFIAMNCSYFLDTGFFPAVTGTLAILLIIPSATAFLALNFTGSTTYTSRSGVKKEIYTYFPRMAWMFIGGVVLSLSLAILRFIAG